MKRIKRLANLVDGFLSKEINREDLISNPEKIQDIERFLGENFYLPKDICDTDIQTRIKFILCLHGLLKAFWEEFTVEMFTEEVYGEYNPVISLYSLDGPMDIFWEEFEKRMLSNYYDFDEKSIEVPKSNLHVIFTEDDGTVSFFSILVDVPRRFTYMLGRVPIRSFRKCDDPNCGKLFVIFAKPNRVYCSRKCAARHKQAKIRAEKPYEFKAYHREYYQKYRKKSS